MTQGRDERCDVDFVPGGTAFSFRGTGGGLARVQGWAALRRNRKRIHALQLGGGRMRRGTALEIKGFSIFDQL